MSKDACGFNHLAIPKDVRSRGIEHDEWVRIESALESVMPTYERMNRLLSLNLIAQWWDDCAEEVSDRSPILEIGCGTGCLSVRISSKGHVCSDPSASMLRETRSRTNGERVYVRCLAESLPFRDRSFDAVCSSFAFRDFRDKQRAFAEAFRVLRPDGKIVIAEIAKANPVVAAVIYNYFKFAIPVLTKVISPTIPRSGNPWLVLPETYKGFGYIDEYEEMMRKVGFKDVRYKYLRGSFALLLTGARP